MVASIRLSRTGHRTGMIPGEVLRMVTSCERQLSVCARVDCCGVQKPGTGGCSEAREGLYHPCAVQCMESPCLSGADFNWSAYRCTGLGASQQSTLLCPLHSAVLAGGHICSSGLTLGHASHLCVLVTSWVQPLDIRECSGLCSASVSTKPFRAETHCP